MAPAPAPEAMFKKDEKALCFHHELLYEAKVLDSKQVDGSDKRGSFEYKVHYKGWKNTWDDWVPEDRLRKLTPENRELANSLRQQMLQAQREARALSASSKKNAKGSTRGSEERQTSVAATTGPRGQKRGRDYEIEKEDAFQNKRAVRIYTPDRLKSLLVDDWENVTKNLQLVPLPASKPAGVILDEYFESQKSLRRLGSADADILEEVVQGMKEYFNKSIGRILLYRFERVQYRDIHDQIESPTGALAGKTMADVYGGQHLLRLFVSLPELIAQTAMDNQSVTRLRQELTDMLNWLSKDANISTYFPMEYESPGQSYVDKIRADN